jgi:hypothetical protein
MILLTLSQYSIVIVGTGSGLGGTKVEESRGLWGIVVCNPNELTGTWVVSFRWGSQSTHISFSDMGNSDVGDKPKRPRRTTTDTQMKFVNRNNITQRPQHKTLRCFSDGRGV